MSLFNQQLEAKVAQAKLEQSILDDAFKSSFIVKKPDSYIGFKPKHSKPVNYMPKRQVSILSSDTEPQREVTGYTPKKQGDRFKFYLNER